MQLLSTSVRIHTMSIPLGLRRTGKTDVDEVYVSCGGVVDFLSTTDSGFVSFRGNGVFAELT